VRLPLRSVGDEAALAQRAGETRVERTRERRERLALVGVGVLDPRGAERRAVQRCERLDERSDAVGPFGVGRGDRVRAAAGELRTDEDRRLRERRASPGAWSSRGADTTTKPPPRPGLISASSDAARAMRARSPAASGSKPARHRATTAADMVAAGRFAS
jgi:hypothetical protein